MRLRLRQQQLELQPLLPLRPVQSQLLSALVSWQVLPPRVHLQ
ncbi:MAG: hypothetical protein V7629_15005 [Motiliproteus sp.]